MLYPQNGDSIVAIDPATSLIPMYIYDCLVLRVEKLLELEVTVCWLSCLVFNRGLAASWTILRHLDLSSADRSKRSAFKPVHTVILSSLQHDLGRTWCRRPEVVPYVLFLSPSNFLFFSICVQSKKAFFSWFLLTDVILFQFSLGVGLLYARPLGALAMLRSVRLSVSLSHAPSPTRCILGSRLLEH